MGALQQLLMRSIAGCLLVVALWSLVCVQGATRTNSMPAQAFSGSSYALHSPHQMHKTNKMQRINRMRMMGEEHEEHEGASALSAKEPLFLPSSSAMGPQEQVNEMLSREYGHMRGEARQVQAQAQRQGSGNGTATGEAEALGTGITPDNAYKHAVTRRTAAAGTVYGCAPAFTLEDACSEVTITGWQLGTGSDITNVTLSGAQADIMSQTSDSVVVRAGRGMGTGDVVVTSPSGTSTLAGGFLYRGADDPLSADFESGTIPAYWSTASTDSDLNVIRYCPSLPCASPPDSGPSVGHGGGGYFLSVSATAQQKTAQLDSYFNTDCTDTVTSISLYYHLWTPQPQCRGTLRVQQLVEGYN
ncbi:hypothetical protein B484DRAFT_407992 [Ochromonadaceae sp. CCMP2298]|nr:hypothetical protein B484DRAFT_407992 [Ochromonadaceae sp. CCMP2298]